MKENIRRGIIEIGVNAQCDELTAYLDEFENELYTCVDGVKWHGYITDMLTDCYHIQREILHTNYYIPDELVKEINKWYDAVQELLMDIRCWLRNECNVKDNIFIRINERLHGK